VTDTTALYLLARQSGRPFPLATAFTAGPQTFTLASQVAITGLSAALGIGTYHVEARVWYVPAGTIASNHSLGFTYGGTVASAEFNAVTWQAQAANAIAQTTSFAISSLSATMTTSPTHVAFNGWHDLEGILVTSAAGTLQATIQLGTAGDNAITQPGSRLRITQLA
jgi:hypothetical protein